MNLKQIIPHEFKKKFLRHQRIGKFLYKHAIFDKFLSRISTAFLSINNDRNRRKRLVDFVATRESADPSKHGYVNKYGDLNAALNYASEVSSPDFNDKSLGESFRLYQEQLITMRELIKLKRPKKVFNFGICYAYVDNKLANEFPDVEFIGIDLSPHNKSFNDVDFFSTKNLTILTGDVFSHFSEIDYSNSIFFHSRILVLLPREFIQKLYKSVYAAGFEFVVGFEQNGLSEEVSVPYVFDTTDKPSVYWRDRMYIHNYPYLVESAGYEVKEADLFTTNHTSPDFQVLRFTAERK